VKSPELGQLNIEVSGEAQAMEPFMQGLLMLHSFEYNDAATKFREAQKADSLFAMAYWGEAMCHNHPLWREQDLKAAREVLDKLGATPEERRLMFKTEFEKDMYDAVAILYGGGSKAQRDKAYMEKMKFLHDKYPDNHEIAAFYALSVLGAVKGGRDFEAYAQGARIAESVIKENPNHPGALHYLIHSYDDPQNAHKALDAANSYSKVAPDAGHALHMPSHIYVALGMWDEVIQSNIASWEASLARKEAQGLDNDALNYHAFKWLMYGYLQKGDYDTARNLVEEMKDYCYELPSEGAASHFIMMKAPYVIESGRWTDSIMLDTLDYSRYSFYVRSAFNYLEAMTAYHKGNTDLLKQHIDTLSYLVDAHTNPSLTSSGPSCAGLFSYSAPTQLQVDRASVMLYELKGLLALTAKNDIQAEEHLRKAVDLEQATSYNYGPPEIVKPSSELYAEFLLERQRYEEAEEQLNLVLNRAPGRLIVTRALDQIKTAS